MNKFVKIIVAIFLVALICYIPFYIVVFKILPERDPDNQFNRATILQVLSGETRVFYEDGENLLGAFFDANAGACCPAPGRARVGTWSLTPQGPVCCPAGNWRLGRVGSGSHMMSVVSSRTRAP